MVSFGFWQECQLCPRVDPAGEGADGVDSAVPAGQVEERAVSGVVEALRQEIEHLFLVGEDIGAAAAAASGGAADGGGFARAEGAGKEAAPEPVGDAGTGRRSVASGPPLPARPRRRGA